MELRRNWGMGDQKGKPYGEICGGNGDGKRPIYISFELKKYSDPPSPTLYRKVLIHRRLKFGGSVGESKSDPPSPTSPSRPGLLDRHRTLRGFNGHLEISKLQPPMLYKDVPASSSILSSSSLSSSCPGRQ
jgi:hypothetical protein